MDKRQVLVAVDDLLFSSKIRAVAKQLGVDLTFARTPAEILERARSTAPSLIVFDLNSAKTDPIGTIETLKADASTAAARVLAFASHVHVDLIEQAKRAGADEVLPRSAFAARLPDILQRA